MKNMKKMLSLIMAIAMMATSLLSTPIFAEALQENEVDSVWASVQENSTAETTVEQQEPAAAITKDEIDAKINAGQYYSDLTAEEKEAFSYCDANRAFQDMEKMLGHNAEAMALLDQQYLAFKNEMLSKSPKELFESCFRIAAVEDVYFYLTDGRPLTWEQENYIITSGSNTLMDMAKDWYEFENNADELADAISDIWDEKLPAMETDEITEEEME